MDTTNGMPQTALQRGADNLLRTCGGLSAGDRLLILCEDPGAGYYDAAAAQAVVDRAHDLSIEATVQTLPFDPLGRGMPPETVEAMRAADRTVFFSRTGDQIRFDASMAEIEPIMCYALDAEMLGSGFGWANYDGFVALKAAVNALLAKAREIRVTCPLGTDFSGGAAAFPEGGAADVSVRRFPMSVFAPVPAHGFSGVVVQAGFLVGTGSTFYEPYARPLNRPVRVRFENDRILGFEGEAEDVLSAKRHYEHVGRLLDLDPMTVHSWHAGIHPGCAFPQTAASNFERWSGGAFGNPRILHLHTCGADAPGEISLNVLDPTIRVDGVAVWRDGVFDPRLVPGGAEILHAHACIRSVFDAPAQEVGQGADGGLSGTDGARPGAATPAAQPNEIGSER